MSKPFISIEEEINTLYEDYVLSFSRDNVESYKKNILFSIVEKMYIFAKSDKYYSFFITDDRKGYSVEFVEAITDSLKYFKDENYNNFYYYVISNINKRFKKTAFNDSFDGVKVSREKKQKINEISKMYDTYKKFGWNHEDCISNIASVTGIDEDDIAEYLGLDKKGVLSLDEKISSGEDDGENDFLSLLQSPYYSDDKILQEEKLNEILNCVETEWKKLKENEKSVHSDLVTADLLLALCVKNYNASSSVFSYSSKNGKSQGLDIKTIFANFDFTNKYYVSDFFEIADYKPPSQKSIAQSYSINNDTANRKLKRFYEKVCTLLKSKGYSLSDK